MKFIKAQYWVIIILVVIYLMLIFKVFNISQDKLQLLAPNEIGDFLAGVFAPLAFLFLLLGYVLQGKQLNHQSEGLKESIEQQNAILELMRQQYLHDKKVSHINAQPKLILKVLRVITSTICESEVTRYKYILKIHIENQGAPIINAKLANLEAGWFCEEEIGSLDHAINEFWLYNENSVIPQAASFDITFLDALKEKSSCKFIIEYNANYFGRDEDRFNIIEQIIDS